MKPMVHRLEADYWERIDFIYIDREHDDNRAVVRRFNVNSQPILFLLDAQGNIITRWAGNPGEGALREAMDTLLARQVN